MEIVGNDNRIRALFSELQLADVQAAPGFSAVWHRAQARSLKPRRAIKFSFAAVTALFALMLGSLGVWSMYLNRSNPRYQAFAELQAIDKVVVPKITTSVDLASSEEQKSVRRPFSSRANRSVVRNGSLIAGNKKTKSITIDSWQSPTAALLTSPADGLFKSLPQLNENANELKSFLPGNSNRKEK